VRCLNARPRRTERPSTHLAQDNAEAAAIVHRRREGVTEHCTSITQARSTNGTRVAPVLLRVDPARCARCFRHYWRASPACPPCWASDELESTTVRIATQCSSWASLARARPAASARRVLSVLTSSAQPFRTAARAARAESMPPSQRPRAKQVRSCLLLRLYGLRQTHGCVLLYVRCACHLGAPSSRDRPSPSTRGAPRQPLRRHAARPLRFPLPILSC
jgi:hypothetical protein